jgi:hypothetical protein
MKPKIPDDLLSAFLDREVTPEEEVLARKHLQTSPQAKEQFQDYQRLGELLHELPRRTVPTEFAAAVMQQAERETLIPLEAAATAPANSQSDRRMRRGWLVAAVGMLATAAAVLIVVNLPARKDAVALRETRVGGTPRSEALLAKATVAPAEKAPSSPEVSKPASEAKVAAREANLPALKYAGALAPASPVPPPVASAPLMQSRLADAGGSRMVFPADLKSAKEGSVIEALESVGNQVAVVRLTLVNQTAGLGGLQSLLVRNASRPVRDEEKEKLMKERFAKEKGSVVLDAKKVSNGPGELICVFVEVSRDDIMGVLKDVQKESQIQHAQLTNAISPERLAEYVQRPVMAANLGGDRSAARAGSVLSVPHDAVNKILADSEAPSQQDAKQAQSTVAAPANNSLALARRRSMPSKAAQTAGAPAQQSVAAKKDQAGTVGGTQLIAGTTPRSYQVFFVLDDQSVTESQDKAPAAAAGEAQVAPESAHVHPRTPVRARKPARKRAVKPN